MAASWWSIKLAYADYLYSQATLESVRRAARLVPDNPSYHSRLAALLHAEDPDLSTAELQTALRLNPRDAKTWIEVGLRAEFRKDYTEAERCLLEAASVDRQYVPRWTLLNYYFRRQQPDLFWRWAREAAPMTFGDSSPLFRLCMQMTADAPGLVQRLGLTKPELIANYLSFLLSENRSEAFAPVARQLLESSRIVDTPLLLTVCDRLLAGNQIDQSLGLWNGLCDKKLLPYQPISGSSRPLTNPDWRDPPLSRGFDWRLPQLDGVFVSRQENPPVLRIEFSGRQPESCEVLTQLVPVAESSSYAAMCHYRTARISPQTGLGWKVIEFPSGRNLAADTLSLSHEEETAVRILFRTLPGTRMVRLSLAYRRAVGTTRIVGTIWLRNMEMSTPSPWKATAFPTSIGVPPLRCRLKVHSRPGGWRSGQPVRLAKPFSINDLSP